jgi:hypothetical protein
MLEDIVQKKKDRRQGPDLWISVLRWMGVSGWLILFAAFVVADKAKPDRGTFIDMMYFQQLGIPVNLRLEWDPQLVTYIFYLMILGLCVSVTGLFINLKRHRRRSDSYRVQLFILGAISLSAIIYHLL